MPFASRLWVRFRPHAPLALITALIAAVATRAILVRTGGVPAVPLDDAFIHFQYARSFAELRPLVYTPGAEPTPGATSLLWPLLLAPLWAIGLRGESIVWAAWLFGWVSFGLLAHETRRLAEGIVRRDTAIAAAAMVLSFGGYVWFAGSGMEVVPLAWLLVRSARRAAEWSEGAANDVGRRRELVLLGVLAPLLRPEAALASVAIALTLALHPRGSQRRRVWGLAPIAALFLPGLVNLVLTGQTTNTTAIVKWLPLSPYHQGARLWPSVSLNLELLFDTLLDGRQWSAIFLPAGGKYVAWIALPALIAVSVQRRVAFRGALVVWIALGILIPTSYDSFLWNRLRYLWPFAAAWFIALAALADGVAMPLASHWRRAASLRLVIAGGFVGANASHLSYAIDDLAESADAIRLQQASLGHWARETLPEDALIGVNDTGAIAYLSERRTFDVVGLTTLGEARYWAAGRGSRFEHFEKLDPAKRPTHFVVYPEWLGLPPLLGDLLTERVVQATILGGTRMVAHAADYSTLGSAEEPLTPPARERIDVLDVADLQSEAEHGYALLDATQHDNALEEHWLDARPIADGARRRRSRDTFTLAVEPGGSVVARVGLGEATELALFVDGERVAAHRAEAKSWQEIRFDLPKTLSSGRRAVELRSEGAPFTSMHYWSYR